MFHFCESNESLILVLPVYSWYINLSDFIQNYNIESYKKQINENTEHGIENNEIYIENNKDN